MSSAYENLFIYSMYEGFAVGQICFNQASGVVEARGAAEIYCGSRPYVHFFFNYFKRSLLKHNSSQTGAMAKKSKLLAALDAHQGRDYKLEKQKKLQKQAAKKLRTKAPGPILEEKGNAAVQANSILPMPQDESDGWESDGSEAAGEIAVCRASVEHL